MNIEWLATFKQVVDAGSYTRASTVLFISQPAVSKQVRQLERFFNAKLTYQVGHELRLTDAGQAVYELACGILRDVETTRSALSERVPVVVVGNPTVLIHSFPRALRLFWSLYPNVEVRTLTRQGPEITEAVQSGAADLGIQTGNKIDASLVATPIRTDLTVLVCSPRHRFASRWPAPLEELAGERIAIPRRGTEARRETEEWFAQRNVKLSNVLEVSTLEEVRTAALENLAVGFVSAFAVAEDLESGRLLQLGMDGFHFPRVTYVIHRKQISPVTAKLAEVLIYSHTLPASATA